MSSALTQLVLPPIPKPGSDPARDTLGPLDLGILADIASGNKPTTYQHARQTYSIGTKKQSPTGKLSDPIAPRSFIQPTPSD